MKIKTRLPRCFARVVLLLLIMFCVNGLHARIKNVGIPFVTNYSREVYNAESQNWSIAQDEKGILYFGNNQGVLSFNGNKWEVFSLPNNSIIRSLKYIDGKLYAGGYNEFGYFQTDSLGAFTYISLSDKLLAQDQSFDEVWRIHETEFGVVFQSYYNVFILNDSKLEILNPVSKFGFSYMVNGELFIVDREVGVYKLSQSKLSLFFADKTFFIENDISFIVPHKADLMFGTTTNGIYLLRNGELHPWEARINQAFIKNQIYTGIELENEQIAIGTIQNGIYIMDADGQLILHMNRMNGLQNNTVLSLFKDNVDNLWLGLDNGIDMLEVNSPFSFFNYSSNIETAYTSIIHNGLLYVGTNQGLFAKPMNEIENDFELSNDFVMVEGTMGQVWSLKVFGSQLFCGHTFGTFIIDKFSSHVISDQSGGWGYVSVPWNKNFVIGGNYSGLNLFQKDDSEWGWKDLGKIPGFDESSKQLCFDKQNSLWITHGIKGVFRLSVSKDLKEVLKVLQYNDQDLGLGEKPYNLVSIGNDILILADDSLYNYNYYKNEFEINYEYFDLFKKVQNITRIIEGINSDIWFFTKNSMGVFRYQEDGTYLPITKPFSRISKCILHGSFENAFSSRNETFIGSDKGLLHYSPTNYKDYGRKFYTYFDEVSIRIKKRDTSNILDLAKQYLPLKPNDVKVAYKYNSIKFKYYSPFFAANNISFSVRLVGFDDGWSDWTKSNYREYTNLREGSYVFEVRAINEFNIESEVLTYEFEIEPPFYRTNYAYLFYVIIILSIVIINYISFKIRIEKARVIEVKKHKEVLDSKEKAFKQEVQQNEEKIEKLEKERLKSEMRHKNMELANSTMNLIHKNKLLNSLKRELLDASDEAKSQNVKIVLKKVVIRIDKDLTNDQNFKVFDEYFDRVHQDFIQRLKENHDNLTPKDIRLCAYLKMNLSTKEIAPLMNVSVRGLEISRYRLRKKLDIEHKQNLVDYIMEL